MRPLGIAYTPCSEAMQAYTYAMVGILVVRVVRATYRRVKAQHAIVFEYLVAGTRYAERLFVCSYMLTHVETVVTRTSFHTVVSWRNGESTDLHMRDQERDCLYPL